MNKLKILFLAANPLGTSRLALDEEIRAIVEKIQLSTHRDAVELISAWAVRPDDLLQVLNQHQPHIVHFSGHGSPSGELVLVDAYGTPKAVGARALTALFSTLKDNIRLVVLNACYSRIQAEAITDVIDSVIGMNEAIGDEAALIFAASVYRAIGFGRSLQEAFEQGKTALMLEGIDEEETPELLVRTGVDSTRLVLLSTLSSHKNAVPEHTSDSGATKGLSVFFSYAHEDESLRAKLVKHLIMMKRQGLITDWYDQEIHAGKDTQEEMRMHLEAARIILLLISPDFLASDELYQGELQYALERHRQREARVIPIVVRDTEGWEQTEFGRLLALPREKKPVTAWSNQDAAFTSIAKDIRRVVEDLIRK
jgi:hypothetical protein